MSVTLRISGHEGLPRFEHAAMATTFEFFIGGHDAKYLREAAREAFALIDQLEGELSFYRENSEVTRINRAATGDVVRVGEATLKCLRVAMAAAEATGGAFDAFAGAEALKAKEQAWPSFLAMGERGEGAAVEVDWAAGAVRRLRADRLLDLGAVGKGHALDAAAALLTEWGVTEGMLVAGGSSVRFLEVQDGPWRLEIGAGQEILIEAPCALGASGLGFQAEHIVDTRGAGVSRRRLRAWALASEAALADAFSTGAMLLDDAELAALSAAQPEISVLAEPWLAGAEVFRSGMFFGR